MSFRHAATATALICLLLAGVWFVFPHWILTHWGLDYGYGAGMLSRRMACFFLGLAVILNGLREVDDPFVQKTVVRGVLAICLSLAALGLYEWLSGHANAGMLYAVGLEVSIALAFGLAAPQASAEPQARLR